VSADIVPQRYPLREAAGTPLFTSKKQAFPSHHSMEHFQPTSSKTIDECQFKMSEIENEAQEIERLRLENSELRGECLKLTDELLSYTGLPGHLHRLDVKTKQLKSLLIRAADALENSPGGVHSH
jgi:predicted nuclease with TOPRIM domain